MESLISVAVFAPLDAPLTYRLPCALIGQVTPGKRVLVPLGKRKGIGVVLGIDKAPRKLDYKPIEAVLDETPAFSPAILEFLKWASDYYLAPPGEVFRMALPPSLTRLQPSTSSRKPRKTPPAVEMNTLLDPLQLSIAQQQVFEEIQQSKLDRFQVHFIHGVTGSGKTEIYFKLLEELLASRKQAICLVPEIALTPQTFKRYAERFGDQVALFHSDLTEKEREEVWRACKSGKVSVLIGTRSALFAPFQQLGLILVDEEQDGSYKQEERVRYHARDLAIVRGKFENVPVILGSATPSVESYWNAHQKKYRLHSLAERFGGANLPEMIPIDLRQASQKVVQKKNLSFLTPTLLGLIEKNLEQRQQTLLFLNRRGFAHFLLCQECAEVLECPNCAISLTYHQRPLKLLCHYCDYQIPPPASCPKCNGYQWLASGIGTERVEGELRAHFPQSRIARMDRDTMTHRREYEKVLEKLREGKIDLLIGTQMIAKGHDYPNVTLVGVLFADTGLHSPDFRASERTFQLITQVAGRAGRASLPGKVVVQGFSLDHFSLDFALHFKVHEFYEAELAHRKELAYPPFGRLILFRIQGLNKSKVLEGIVRLKKMLEELRLEKNIAIQVLGPGPCLVERVRNQYRWQILVKTPLGLFIQPLIRERILSTSRKWLPSGTRLIIDVDPMQVS